MNGSKYDSRPVSMRITPCHLNRSDTIPGEVAPGPIADTPGTAKLAPGLSSEDVEEMIAERVPLGRLGRAFDISMAAVFLACDASGGYVTGDVLVVDGGEWLYKPPMVEKELVAELSRKVEAKSRALRPKMTSKL